jgi:hypothetical protein
MDVFVLNDLLIRETAIDTYYSFIWSERVASVGDFELVVPNTPEMRGLLAIDKRLAINESKRVMICETHDAKQDEQGRDVLTVTGRSMEKVLMERVAWPNPTAGSDTAPKWVFTAHTPKYVADQIFLQTCVTGVMSVSDKIPLYNSGTMYPPDGIAPPDDLVTFEFEIGTVYERIKDVCDQYKMGFRLYRGPDTSKLYFNIYTGNDRTTQQTVLDPVVFSPNLDNLAKIQELTSIENLKNVAFVYSKTKSIYVYADGADASTAGFNRRVLLVDATSVDEDTEPALTNILTQKGKEALAKNRSITAFDGEISQADQYTYGVDYELGDIVEMQSGMGVTNQMRVTEQIFVSDSTGSRSYPTLSVDLLITPGSWLAWDSNEEWAVAVGTWAEQ